MRLPLRPFVRLSAVGMVLGLVVHAGAHLSAPIPLMPVVILLGLGWFVAVVPTIFALNGIVRARGTMAGWKAIFRASPKWLLVLMYALFAYALVVLVREVAGAEGQDARKEACVVFASVQLAAGYSMVLVWLWAASRLGAPDRICPNGHPVAHGADYCKQCGAPVAADGASSRT